MKITHKHIFAFLVSVVFLNGCATHTVKTTSYTPVIQDSQNVSEDFLLDVGICLLYTSDAADE